MRSFLSMHGLWPFTKIDGVPEPTTSSEQNSQLAAHYIIMFLSPEILFCLDEDILTHPEHLMASLTQLHMDILFRYLPTLERCESRVHDSESYDHQYLARLDHQIRTSGIQFTTMERQFMSHFQLLQTDPASFYVRWPASPPGSVEDAICQLQEWHADTSDASPHKYPKTPATILAYKRLELATRPPSGPGTQESKNDQAPTRILF